MLHEWSLSFRRCGLQLTIRVSPVRASSAWWCILATDSVTYSEVVCGEANEEVTELGKQHCTGSFVVCMYT